MLATFRHYDMRVPHHNVHQRAFPGRLRTRDCDNLVIGTSIANGTALDEILQAIVEVTNLVNDLHDSRRDGHGAWMYRSMKVSIGALAKVQVGA
jgi:hypothetical protein